MATPKKSYKKTPIRTNDVCLDDEVKRLKKIAASLEASLHATIEEKNYWVGQCAQARAECNRLATATDAATGMSSTSQGTSA